MGMGMHCSSFPEKGMEVEMGRMGDTVGWKLQYLDRGFVMVFHDSLYILFLGLVISRVHWSCFFQ
jgi:hypothetical protein